MMLGGTEHVPSDINDLNCNGEQVHTRAHSHTQKQTGLFCTYYALHNLLTSFTTFYKDSTDLSSVWSNLQAGFV